MSVWDRWGRGARTGAGKRYEVRWRDGGVQRKRRFETRAAAETFDAKRRLDPRIADQRPQLTVQQMLDAYLSGIGGLRPKTQDAYRYDAAHVVDAFGERLAQTLKPSEIRAWVARPGPSASVRHRGLMMLRRCYRLAIADRLLVHDPTEQVALPRLVKTPMRFLSWAELERLAKAAGDSGPLVMLLGTTGLRLGEALGLDQDDVDRFRRRIRVKRSWSVSSEGRELGPTKGSKEREVPVQPSVLEVLPKQPGPLFVGEKGQRLDPHSWRARTFKPAATAAGLGDMHPHELRHTAASLAIASGADPKSVQRMLGHSNAAMTLNRYANLWDSQLDTVADAMEQARRMASGEDEES